MKRIYNKILFKKISDSLSQFISILVISIIGIAMFVGVLSVGQSMKKNEMIYLDDQKISDIQLMSYTGFSDKQLDIIKKETNQDIQVSTNLDANVNYDNNDYISRLSSTSDYNKLSLVEGKLPTGNECALSGKHTAFLNKEINIEIAKQNKKCKVVGIVESPQYISHQFFEYSTKSVGQITDIIYVQPEFVKKMFNNFPYLNYKNTISITLKDKPTNDIFSTKYADYVAKYEKKLKDKLNDSHIIITTANDNVSINSYQEASDSIAKIAAIFPVIFFLVAVFVAASNMSRIISEDRLKIGTMLALGYTKASVVFIYVLFAFFAVLIGSIIGTIIGASLIPKIVIQNYSEIYYIPVQNIVFNWDIISIAFGILFVLIVGSTWLVAYNQTRDNVATLLRPKAPVAGKKIFLESIPFIWKKLSFINKVSIRNLFLYKRRLIMSLLAIIGSSSLLMTGLGVRTSVTPIVNEQYNEIYKYNLQVSSTQISNNQLASKKAELNKFKDIKAYTFTSNEHVEIVGKDDTFDVTLISPSNNDNLNKLIKLDETFNDNKVLITNKLANQLNISPGEKIEMVYAGNEYNILIDGITNQYIGNYLYVGKNVLKDYDINLAYNNIYLKSDNLKQTTKELKKMNFVQAIIDMEDVKETSGESFDSLNSIVFVIIGFAGALIITVMYTLNNINIVERERELATLKVLGFYEKEVNNYLLKENITINIIGLIIGLIIGKFLHVYIITQAEMPDVSMIKTQPFYNYILAFVITFVFYFIVDFFMRIKIKKIDMISSLKSIE